MRASKIGLLLHLTRAYLTISNLLMSELEDTDCDLNSEYDYSMGEGVINIISPE